MKKLSRVLAIVLVIAALCAMTAMAAPESEKGWDVRVVETKTGFDLTPLTADKEKASANGNVYSGVARFTLTFEGSESEQYMVFMLSASNEGWVPTAGNIRYINQANGSGTVTFDVYPDSLESAGEYRIYVTGGPYEYDANKPAATLKVGEETSEYALGDVNQDGSVNSRDALLVLQHSVGQSTLTGTKATLADVNQDGAINSRDAALILQMSVGLE